MRKRKPLITQIFRDFISLFFPDYCLGCSNTLVKGEKLICSRCMLEMPQTKFHLLHENPLKLRMSGRIPIVYALGFFKFLKRGRIQHILHALKYKNQPEVAVVLGRVYGEMLRERKLQFDLIIPVPLHSARQRKRGYNQSAKFAEGLAASLGTHFSDRILIRTTRTSTQTNKTKLKRWENVHDVFALREGLDLNDKHVLVVDDVITTGATVEACAAILSARGCHRVSIAAIAVA